MKSLIERKLSRRTSSVMSSVAGSICSYLCLSNRMTVGVSVNVRYVAKNVCARFESSSPVSSLVNFSMNLTSVADLSCLILTREYTSPSDDPDEAAAGEPVES